MPRALWKGSISFGLVAIPVSLYPAKNAKENISFHMLHKSDLQRVHHQYVDDEGHDVPYEDVVKGYEYEKDRYVVIEEEDLKSAGVETTQTIDIMHFVEGGEIDLAYYDTPYYTEPTKAGRKAYALLRDTLKGTEKVGVAKIVIRERQHLCAVLPDGPVILAYTLRWPYQLRDISELELPGEDKKRPEVSPQELKMAEQLVETMTTAWNPEQYRDTYREDLLSLIEDKVKHGKVTKAPEAVPQQEEGAQVVDIMALLKRSVEARDAVGEDSEKTGRAAAAKTKPPRTKAAGKADDAPPKRQSGRRAAG